MLPKWLDTNTQYPTRPEIFFQCPNPTRPEIEKPYPSDPAWNPSLTWCWSHNSCRCFQFWACPLDEGGGEPFWVDPPEGWYHVALCRLADFFANHNYKKIKVKTHLFVPSNTNGQSLQVGPKTCFLTSHYVNRMLGSKNLSKIQNWHPNFFSSTTIP